MRNESFSSNRTAPERAPDAGSSLIVGGFVPLTTVDFPGVLAAVVFCAGCSWKCPYCHNPHLRSRHPASPLDWRAILKKLHGRRAVLEGVVFSGGEPLLQPGLPTALREVRAMGYRTALHTAGALPKRLEEALPLLDWVGLDVKTVPDHRYDALVGKPGAARCFRESLRMVEKSGIAFQLRTTTDPRWIPAADIEEMQQWLAARGLPASILQPARFPEDSHPLPPHARFPAA